MAFIRVRRTSVALSKACRTVNLAVLLFKFWPRVR
jgi:hypothetical protein